MNLRSIYIGVSIAVATVLFTSCDNKKNKEVNPEAEFFKIYDNQKYIESYYPLDIKAVSDGYLILGKRRITSSAYFGCYVMKIDKTGQFISETLVDEQYVNPLPTFCKISGSYYFVCMDNTTLESKIMQVNSSGAVTESATVSTAMLPVSVSTDGNNLLLLNYDKDELQMEVSLVNSSGAISGFEEFNIGFGDLDIEELVIDHLTGNGQTLPFLTGSLANGTYYYNGYFNYNFNTIFFSFGGSSVGQLQGYRNERFVTSLEYLNGSKFATTWADNGTHKVNTKANISYTGGSLAGVPTLEGNLLLEYLPASIPVVKKVSLAGKNLLVYGSTTNSNEMVLYFYEESGGNFIASILLGYSHAYRMGNFETSDDGGLVVSGLVMLEGRFPRICVFKLSEDQIKAKLNPSEDDK
jgi:hypothetical protein